MIRTKPLVKNSDPDHNFEAKRIWIAMSFRYDPTVCLKSHIHYKKYLEIYNIYPCIASQNSDPNQQNRILPLATPGCRFPTHTAAFSLLCLAVFSFLLVPMWSEVGNTEQGLPDWWYSVFTAKIRTFGGIEFRFSYIL